MSDQDLNYQDLQQRIEQIKQTLQEVENMEARQQGLLDETLANARAEADRIIADANANAQQIREQAREEGRKGVIEEKQRIESERNALQSEVDKLRSEKQEMLAQLGGLSDRLQQTIASSKPEPVQAAPTPMEPAPAPAPAEPAPEPVAAEPAPIPIPVPAPIPAPAPTPVEAAPAPVEPTPAPAPAEPVPAPTAPAPEPVSAEPAPIPTPVPAPIPTPAPTPVEAAPAPVEPTLTPAPAEPAPASAEPAPAQAAVNQPGSFSVTPQGKMIPVTLDEKPKKKHRGLKIFLWILFVLAVAAAVCFGFFFGIAKVSDDGMKNVAGKGDYVFYSKMDKDPDNGDVILIKDRKGTKRLRYAAATAGEVVDFDTMDGNLYIDDDLAVEAFEPGADDTTEYPHEVGDNEIYVLCDNREAVSQEGLFSKSSVKGRVLLVFRR